MSTTRMPTAKPHDDAASVSVPQGQAHLKPRAIEHVPCAPTAPELHTICTFWCVRQKVTIHQVKALYKEYYYF